MKRESTSCGAAVEPPLTPPDWRRSAASGSKCCILVLTILEKILPKWHANKTPLGFSALSGARCFLGTGTCSPCAICSVHHPGANAEPTSRKLENIPGQPPASTPRRRCPLPVALLFCILPKRRRRLLPADPRQATHQGGAGLATERAAHAVCLQGLAAERVLRLQLR